MKLLLRQSQHNIAPVKNVNQEIYCITYFKLLSYSVKYIKKSKYSKAYEN